MSRTDNKPVVVITGASAGVGKATAKMLVAQGWHVIGHGRDPERTKTATEEIAAAASADARFDMVRGDLSLLRDTNRLADEIFTLAPWINALLNNAGGVRNRLMITDEGNEVTFAGNHLGHFLLTKRLLPVMRTTASNQPGIVRVINVTSDGHAYPTGVDWGNLQYIQNWESAAAYCNAKLCNVLFAR